MAPNAVRCPHVPHLCQHGGRVSERVGIAVLVRPDGPGIAPVAPGSDDLVTFAVAFPPSAAGGRRGDQPRNEVAARRVVPVGGLLQAQHVLPGPSVLVRVAVYGPAPRGLPARRPRLCHARSLGSRGVVGARPGGRGGGPPQPGARSGSSRPRGQMCRPPRRRPCPPPPSGHRRYAPSQQHWCLLGHYGGPVAGIPQSRRHDGGYQLATRSGRTRGTGRRPCRRRPCRRRPCRRRSRRYRCSPSDGGGGERLRGVGGRGGPKCPSCSSGDSTGASRLLSS